jgi:UDP-N-acetylmuramate-alanine ligase
MAVLVNEVKPGDVVLTLGAGDIHHIGTELLERIEA